MRFSTPEQAKGDSLRRQTELSERFAREHGLTLDDKLTFRDLGKSGFRGKNVQEGELGAFIAAVESGKVKRGSFLLVENLDRLSRQPARAALRQLERIVELGVTVVTLQDRKEYSSKSLDENFTDLLSALLIMQRGHEESATKSARVKAAWAAKRKRAIESGAPMTGALPAWVSKDPATGTLKLHADRAKVVRRIFEEASKGVGHHTIARRLNKAKVPLISHKRNSRAWYSSYVFKILHNPAVIGHTQPHKMGANGKRMPEGEVLTEYFPRVVSDSLYYKVRDQRASKRNPSGPKGTHGGNLFQGLAKCFTCKRSMTKVNKGSTPKGGTYLVCSTAQRGKGCKYDLWRMDDFELGVLTILSNDVDWRDQGERIEAHSQEEIERLEKEHSKLRLKLASVERRLLGIQEDMAADHAEGHGASPMLRAQRRQAEKEHAALSKQIADTNECLSIESNKAARARTSAKDAHEAFREWLSKYSLAAGRKKSIPKTHGVTESDLRDARERLKVILGNLVEAIWVNSEDGEAWLAFRHSPKEWHPVILGGFTIFEEE